MSRVRAAAVVAAALIGATAVLQVALAAGAPWGDHAYGGSASTADGVLPLAFRVASAAAAVVLVLAARDAWLEAGCGREGDAGAVGLLRPGGTFLGVFDAEALVGPRGRGNTDRRRFAE